MVKQVLINFINKYNSVNKSIYSSLIIHYNSYLLSILNVCKQAKMIANFTILNKTKNLCQISLFKTNIVLKLQSSSSNNINLKYRDLINFSQKMSNNIYKIIGILSTNVGILTHDQAFDKHIGGLYLFSINFYDAIT